MLFELAWAAAIAIIGALALARAASGLPMRYVAIFAYPTGVVLGTLLIGLISIAVPAARSAIGLAITAGLVVALLLLLLAGRARTRPMVVLLGIGAALIPVAAGFILLNLFDTGFLVGDTTIQSVLARTIADYGWSSENARSSLANWSFAYTFIQLVGASGGRVYYALLQPIIAIISIFAFALTLFEVTLRKTTEFWPRWAVPVSLLIAVMLTGATFLTCFYFALVLTVLTSNILLAGFACLLVLAMLSLRDGATSQGNGAVLICACLAGIGLSRAEGLVYVSFFALWLTSAGIVENRYLLRILAGAIVPVAVINVVLTVIGHDELSQFAIVPPLAMAGIIVVSLAWLPFVRFVVPRLPPALLASAMTLVAILLAILAGIGLLLSEKLQLSLSALMVNIYGLQFWGVVPLLLLTVSPLLVGWSRDRVVSSGMALALALCCVIVLLALGRTPYYVDINDSGHRLIGSFALPMTLVMLAGCIQLFPARQGAAEAHSANPSNA